MPELGGSRAFTNPRKIAVNSAVLTDYQQDVGSAADTQESGRGRYSAQRLSGGLKLMLLTQTAGVKCSVSKQGLRARELCLACLKGRCRNTGVTSDGLLLLCSHRMWLFLLYLPSL